MIKADGNTFTFVTDEPMKSWDIMNPDKIKGHEGRHVQLTARVYSDKNKINVMSVKVLDDSKPKNK